MREQRERGKRERGKESASEESCRPERERPNDHEANPGFADIPYEIKITDSQKDIVASQALGKEHSSDRKK